MQRQFKEEKEDKVAIYQMQNSNTYNLPSHLEQFQVLPVSTQKTQTNFNGNVVPYLKSVVCYRLIA